MSEYMRIFNEGNTVKSHWDNKEYVIIEVWGEILRCVDKNGYTELMDFEVDLIQSKETIGEKEKCQVD